MPLHDGDGSDTRGEEGLVAEIIPLRRRTPACEEPRELAPQDDCPSTKQTSAAERSVWEPPTKTDLRRRTPQVSPGSLAAHGRWSSALRTPQRRVLAALTVVAALGVTLGVLVFGAVGRRPGVVSQRTNASVSVLRTASKNGATALAARHTAQVRPARSSLQHRRGASSVGHRPHTTHHATSSLTAAREADRASAAADAASAGASVARAQVPTTVPEQHAATQENAGISQGEHGTDERSGATAATGSQTAPSQQPATPPAAASQCVPGELGC